MIKKGVYIHIPFCKHICHYCDFCKIYYNAKDSLNYLKALEQEIKLNYNGEPIKSIYIGGGTPSCLNLEELDCLLTIIQVFNQTSDCEITLEYNPNDICSDKLKVIVQSINRLSIGTETTNPDFLNFLGRHDKFSNTKKIIDLIPIKNISLDLIYALPNQTLVDLKNDLDKYLELNPTHISTYSLQIEPNTRLFIDQVANIDEDLDREMYDFIVQYLKTNGYIHYEISNFAKAGYESKHNLIYWNNEQYYGFGLGSHGFINNYRYENTRSIREYLNGQYLKNKEKMTLKTDIENALILGLRKIEGINKGDFKQRYKSDLKQIKGVQKLLQEGKLGENETHIYLKEEYLYVSNRLLVEVL